MIRVQTLDRKIWRKDLLLVHLHNCHLKNTDAVIDFVPEGSCAEMLGLYRLLDEFCATTGYEKNRITIKTANMLEHHAEYVINKQPEYWYEINSIQTWLQGKNLTITYTPTKHFVNFISRSNWYRLWVATILDKYCKDKTIQTYHYDPNKQNYNANGYIGLDDLIKYKCDIVADAAEFIETCPRTLDIEFLQDLNNCKDSIYQHENSYYPIQHPSNLNLLQYYNDIFVDIVCEPNISGNCFLVTEKLWRCIVARRPFVVVSNADYLKNLRRLGFKTFSPWWSEEYDMYGSQHRIKKIEKLIFDLSRLTLNELECILKEMNEVLDHNFNTFKGLTVAKIGRNFIND